MIKFNLTYKPYGDAALLIEWPAEMREEILMDLLNFKRLIENQRPKGIVEIIQSIHSLTIVFNPEQLTFEVLTERLQKMYTAGADRLRTTIFNLWKIPVCYDEQYGIDLNEFVAKKKLSLSEIVALHSSITYRVYSIGFLPGFLYLGGLDHRLHMDRKTTPRMEIKKGAVAIGGAQTGIYPTASPGGWQIIGNTPVSFFDVSLANPCFAKPGDQLQFIPVSIEEHEAINALIEQGKYVLEKEVLVD